MMKDFWMRTTSKSPITFRIKKIIAWFFKLLGLSDFLLKKLDEQYAGQYIRIVNYHDTKAEDASIFEEHLKWYAKYFQNVNFECFQTFLDGGRIEMGHPGIMLTFDDGKKGNFDVAYPLLEKYGFTGYFLCSSDLVGTEGYMSAGELKELILSGHIIGDHTATHHRIEEYDTDEILGYEIVKSKEKLEKQVGSGIEVFCWCGGEEEHYTKRAHDLIKKAKYRYSFMTNSAPVFNNTDPYHIQRINVESGWPVYLMKFQISGFMDWRFKSKRMRVNKKLIRGGGT